MKRVLILLICLSLGSCAHVVVPPNATPADIAAASAVEKQANFNAVCKYGSGIWQIAKPFAVAKAAQLGSDGTLAVAALDAFVTGTCNTSLNINDADAVIQRGYDVAGKVVALVLAAQ